MTTQHKNFENVSDGSRNNALPIYRTRVRRHFRFEAKWSETEAKFFSLRCEKKGFFCLFRIDAKHRNLKWNENRTKRKQNEKKQKTAIIFASKRNEAKRKQKTAILFASKQKKQNGSEKLPSFSLRSEMEANFFRFKAKKLNEAKQNEKEAKTSKRKLQSEKG
jgi:hypothetical protein